MLLTGWERARYDMECGVDVCCDVFPFACCVLMVHVICECQVDLPSHVMILLKLLYFLILIFMSEIWPVYSISVL